MKKKLIWVVAVIVILASAAYFVKSSDQPIEVKQVAVTQGTVEKYVEETAEVKIKDSVGIYGISTGIATKVNAEVGQTVKKGSLLVQLDAQTIALQIKDLEAQIAMVKAQYAEAKKPARKTEIEKLEAQLRAAQAVYDAAKQMALNNKTLLDTGSISQDIYRTTLVDMATKEAALYSAKSNLEIMKSGLSNNIKAQYNAQLAELQSRLDLLKKQKKDLGILAPKDGMILSKSIEQGGYVQPGKVLFLLGNQNSLFLSCDVLVEDMAGVKEGTVVRIENKDLNIENALGKVSKIAPMAFTKLSELGINQKRINVEIQLSGKLPDIKAGYEMTAKIMIEKKDNALLVDKKALFDYQGKDAVFVNEGGMAKLKVIEKGIENDESIEIIKGLVVGEQVILSPDETLKEGSKLK